MRAKDSKHQDIYDPVCPKCGEEGIGNIVCHDAINVPDSPEGVTLFRIVFCERCGHVYSAIPYFEQNPADSNTPHEPHES